MFCKLALADFAYQREISTSRLVVAVHCQLSIINCQLKRRSLRSSFLIVIVVGDVLILSCRGHNIVPPARF
jgi:hypothetical protein